ncbi:MAG: REP-associated tyrosine transposase [Anaerolineaceae bacterium]
MPNYHRNLVEGGTYFFTVVTYQRHHILTHPTARKILHHAWETTNERHPFQTLAICLLPDHIHCIWKLPDGDSDYSTRWKEIKRHFSLDYQRQIGSGEDRNPSHQKQKEAAIWQRRFWEHTLEDEDDFDAHFDYIHFNPVKHGYVEKPSDWQWSTFHRYVKDGIYVNQWCGGDIGKLGMLDFE